MAGEKKIRLTAHATVQCVERGTTAEEVAVAIRNGWPEPAKFGRLMYRANFRYDQQWNGTYYRIKQVAPVVAEEAGEFVVVTVYTFYY